MPTVFDDSFKGAGQRPGLEIWRIEKLKVVKKGPDNKAYEGQFHTGDSYILLHTRVRVGSLARCLHASSALATLKPRRHLLSACVSRYAHQAKLSPIPTPVHLLLHLSYSGLHLSREQRTKLLLLVAATITYHYIRTMSLLAGCNRLAPSFAMDIVICLVVATKQRARARHLLLDRRGELAG